MLQRPKKSSAIFVGRNFKIMGLNACIPSKLIWFSKKTLMLTWGKYFSPYQDGYFRFKNRAIDDLSKELRFYCPVDKCIKFFKEKKLLIQHFQKSHGEKKFECNLCQTKFSLERDLKYHKTKTCPIAKGLELTQSIVDGFEKMTLLEPEKKKDSLKDKEIKKK